MKPDGGTDEKRMEATDVDPSEFFQGLGMLILESRLPLPSVKGRQDGPHCPPALGDRPSHVCDLREPLCKRAMEMQKQMQTLWRNRIPMCIEVLLFPDCCHGQSKASSTDAAPPVVGDGCVLLEQWTIQMVAKKQAESCISSKALFQAVRSYLHFSQLSAWLNLTHGNEPCHVGYRVSPPAEFCTTTFSKMPESHLFPLASANKSTKLKVTLAHLPRLPEIPKPVCYELTGKQPCGVVDYPVTLTSMPRSSSPKVVHQMPQCVSPKLDKPNVLHALTAEEREVLMRTSKCQCVECTGNKSSDTPVVRTDATATLKVTAGYPKSSPELFGDALRQKTDPLEAVSYKDSGAIPKRFSLQLQSIPEDLLTKHPRSPQHPKSTPSSDCGTSDETRKHTDPKQHSVLGSIPPFVSRCKDLIPEVLPNQCMFLDGMDSSSSSPDYDHFLSKTLMKQSEPLTLEEMEAYLQRLYQPTSDSSTKSSSGFGSYGVKPFPGKLEMLDNRKGTLSVTSSSRCGFLEEESLRKKVSLSYNEREMSLTAKRLGVENKSACSSGTDDLSISKREVLGKQPHGLTCLPRQPSCRQENRNLTGLNSSENSGMRTRDASEPESSDTPKSRDFRPVFTVGDAGEVDERWCRDCDLPRSSSSVTQVLPSAPKQSQERDDGSGLACPGASPSVGSPRGLRKSISCPSKPTLKGSGLQKASSLLRTVMKKEMVTQEAISSDAGHHRPCVPTDQERIYFRQGLEKSTRMVFHATSGLPLQSSPVPAKKMSSGSFDYDSSLDSVRAIKNSLSCINLDAQNDDECRLVRVRQSYSTSAPASTNCLLGNFEESLINGRIEPAGVVDGFTVDIGASGSFCPQHFTLPVTAFFFSLSDDNAPSPYLGHINLESYSKRGYHVPKQGTIQVTLFNPNKTVVKMFVVKYDMSDMPPNHQTVLRQRTLYMPVKGSPSDVPGVMVYLRYLIHLRFASSKTSKIYLHTDIRVIFARDKFELDSRVANYELRSFTEGPENPKFSPRKCHAWRS